jgi:two-component system, NarL family, invasion response regulator UvrY
MAETTIRVAVCDDARAVKLFMQHVLEEEGDIQVVSATSTGRDALDELGRCRPDALLLDLVLPDVADPGILVRQLREQSPGMAILLISNMPDAQLEEQAGRLGADGWMPKAQKPAALRAAVRQVVAAAR